MSDNYHVIGVMSGTSLDGLDIAYCKLIYDKNAEKQWNYEIVAGKTYPYSTYWQERLRTAHTLNALDFVKLHKEYGRFIGELVSKFVADTKIHFDLVASHGHTIFHRPEQHISVQIGDGAFIAAETGITTVCDFRNLDLALHGHGAPLVPVGDQLLFGEYEYCLNIGGYANISYNKNKQRIAYDICPANAICNHLANTIDKPYDANGEIGRSGTIRHELFKRLNNLTFYNLMPPKSLGKEWLETNFIPLVDSFRMGLADKLCTLYEHIAYQIHEATKSNKKQKLLITGGGAKNTFLIERIGHYSNHEIVIPDISIIDYKEALIFALLGVLRYRRQINCLHSATGAASDNVGGIVHYIQ